jgi:heme/copper-type cytochrome/quinol oxidase subunit 2
MTAYHENNSHSHHRDRAVKLLASIATLLLLLAAVPALADTPPEVAITIKGQQFVPSEVQIPAGVQVKLTVRNEDKTPDEFESSQLHREQLVLPGHQITIFVGPLDPGRYEFFDDFHPKTRGHLIVK